MHYKTTLIPELEEEEADFTNLEEQTDVTFDAVDNPLLCKLRSRRCSPGIASSASLSFRIQSLAASLDVFSPAGAFAHADAAEVPNLLSLHRASICQLSTLTVQLKIDARSVNVEEINDQRVCLDLNWPFRPPCSSNAGRNSSVRWLLDDQVDQPWFLCAVVRRMT
eukprot:GHVN01016340.1.p1 GENE.GHVN01016340.1~~GHVN01016340.1.p1  ORF type:complete len:166 (+),score=10.04 GHVN01016340.1:427-924(+)